MPTLIHLRALHTGGSCDFSEYDRMQGQRVLTVTMFDGCETADNAQEALFDAAAPYGQRVPSSNFDPSDLATVTRWCAAQWDAAQADLPARRDREGGTSEDNDRRFLECHILATWEV